MRTAGDTQHTSAVSALPPNALDNSRVSFESRNGGCLLLPWLSCEMMVPSVMRLLLMWLASFSRAPVAPVLEARSDPARSTTHSTLSRTLNVALPRLLVLLLRGVAAATERLVSSKRQMVWLRDDCRFMRVDEMWRCFSPSEMTVTASSASSSFFSVTPRI